AGGRVAGHRIGSTARIRSGAGGRLQRLDTVTRRPRRLVTISTICCSYRIVTGILTQMTEADTVEHGDGLSAIARQVHSYSIERWGRAKPTRLVGRAPAFLAALDRVAKY